MATKRVLLHYPEELIQEPVLGQLVKQFGVMPNIRRAQVTDTVGEIAVELMGDDDDLEEGIRYLEERGVDVAPLEGDLVCP